MKKSVFLFVFLAEQKDILASFILKNLAHICPSIRTKKQKKQKNEKLTSKELYFKLLETIVFQLKTTVLSGNNSNISSFLKKRKLTLDICSNYDLGACEKNILNLQDFPQEFLENSGILQKRNDSQKNPYMNFPLIGMLVFAIRDLKTNKIIGLSARQIDEEKRPRYLHINNNAFFNKSEHIYWVKNPFTRNKSNVYPKEKIFITEGFFDVISLEKTGQAALATMGVMFSPEQLKIIAKLAEDNPIVIAFDNDNAGFWGGLKLYKNIISTNVIPSKFGEVYYAYHPDSKDIDEAITNNRKIEILSRRKYIEMLIKQSNLEKLIEIAPYIYYGRIIEIEMLTHKIISFNEFNVSEIIKILFDKVGGMNVLYISVRIKLDYILKKNLYQISKDKWDIDLSEEKLKSILFMRKCKSLWNLIEMEIKNSIFETSELKDNLQDLDQLSENITRKKEIHEKKEMILEMILDLKI